METVDREARLLLKRLDFTELNASPEERTKMRDAKYQIQEALSSRIHSEVQEAIVRARELVG